MKKLKISIIIFITIMLVCPIHISRAMDFNPNYIISDSDLTDSNALTLDEIRKFLVESNGTLANYSTFDKDEIKKSASEIIWQASQDYQINPKFLLVMLQKEQSLIEDNTPTQKQYDWAMGYGVCDSCSMNDPRLIKFKGFGKQVDWCAWRNRWYIDNKDNGWLKVVGKTYKIDGKNININNQATANLYNYTPHIQGNYNFWKIWHQWFTLNYPDGTLLQADGESGVWLIENGMRRAFLSKSALISRYDLVNIITVSKTEIEKYEIGNPIKFPNYSILKTPMDNIYLLVDNKLRKFESPEVLRLLGINPEEYENLEMADFDNYELGEPITLAEAYPVGALLQNKKTGGVYFVEAGQKHPIITRDILKLNYANQNLIAVTPEELEKYPTRDSIKLKNGLLVRSFEKPTVFVVSNGTKKPVMSAEIFETLGYKWDNVRFVEEKSLSNLELGSAVDLEFKN